MINHRLVRVTIVALVVASLGVAGCSTSSNIDTATSATTAESTTMSSAALWAPPGSGDLSAQTADELQAALDKWVERGSLKGMTAAVVTPDGVWSGAAGVDAAGTPLQADSALSLQSISKTFTAAEVMLLAGRGLVDLDAPITDYVEVPFDTQGATVRQLLAMRSGFPDYTTEASQTAIAEDLDRQWTISEAMATLPADAPGLGTLGGEPRYNNLNYQLLAELVAKVTKQSFAQALRADLLDPAGLQRTWVQTGETPTAPLTVGGQAAYADIVDPAGPFMPSRSFASFTHRPWVHCRGRGRRCPVGLPALRRSGHRLDTWSRRWRPIRRTRTSACTRWARRYSPTSRAPPSSATPAVGPNRPTPATCQSGPPTRRWPSPC